MFFQRVESYDKINQTHEYTIFLIRDSWNDWWEFDTRYKIIVGRPDGKKTSLGNIKIGQQGLQPGTGEALTSATVPDKFEKLDDNFFSIGMAEYYYEMLASLPHEIKQKIVIGLRDIAYDNSILDAYKNEVVMHRSLLRSISEDRVRGRFHRLAHGDLELTPFHFSFIPANSQNLKTEYNVTPGSFPPTNIHVLIGRNGVGKTRFLTNMVKTFASDEHEAALHGTFSLDEGQSFSNAISISFSAFDRFLPPKRIYRHEKIWYTYVGLKVLKDNLNKKKILTDDQKVDHKTIDDLNTDLFTAIKALQGTQVERWQEALKTLETEPLFKNSGVDALISEEKDIAMELIKKLSSGHNIVLLTMAKLVELVDENTLVILDEPEAHLHPPLLSAFIRALSDLLKKRNGVAIIATHSPVILQEVPRSCVWIMQRVGMQGSVSRPDFETFGENVGTLTRGVFGLELIKSGYHKLLQEQVDKFESLDDLLSSHGDQLGAEAIALASTLFKNKNTPIAAFD